ncbi:hypothetical protein ABPG74_021298 [Tetrahymena malaccensis]
MTAVYAQDSQQQEYILKVNNCTEKRNSTCVQDLACNDMMSDLRRCLNRCYKKNLTNDQIPGCYKQNCYILASNNTNANIKNYNDIYYGCLSMSSAGLVEQEAQAMMERLFYCFNKNCYYQNVTQDQMPNCYKINCASLVNNNPNSKIANLTDKFYGCLSSGVIQFTFILLITIFSAIIVQY